MSGNTLIKKEHEREDYRERSEEANIDDETADYKTDADRSVFLKQLLPLRP
jgi:hypothetical protein